MSATSQPTLAGFQWFTQNIMGINVLYLPTDAPILGWALAMALNEVNPALACIGNAIPGLPATNLYTTAVYNLAGSIVLNLAPDQTGRTYFQDERKKLGIASFAPGVIASTGDESTSTSLLNPEFMKQFTMANLQQIKDPWGRMYLSIAQDYGPSVIGLS